MNQALGLLSDFKLGQYCKLPPRVRTRHYSPALILKFPKVTFFAQISGAIVGSVLNYVMIVSK